MIKIAPSILSADFAKLGDEIHRIEEAGADLIHIDVMDGNFVPNITLGPPIIKSLRNYSMLCFDVHLMIDNPDKYIDDFVDAGADLISFHVECSKHLHRTIQKIRQRGVKSAVALNPATSLSTIEYILPDVDMVLLMSVNPGFGGQSYINSVTDKIKDLKHNIDSKGLKVDIEVDGGIGPENIEIVSKAGANVIVSGSALFKSADLKAAIEDLRKRAY